MRVDHNPPLVPNPVPADLPTVNRLAGENLRWALEQASEYARGLGLGISAVTLKHHGYSEHHLDEEDLCFLDWLDVVLHYDAGTGPCCAEIGGLLAGYGSTANTTPHARSKEDILASLKTLIDDYLKHLEDDPPKFPVELRGKLDTVEGITKA